jgi:hypothetical protein
MGITKFCFKNTLFTWYITLIICAMSSFLCVRASMTMRDLCAYVRACMLSLFAACACVDGDALSVGVHVCVCVCTVHHKFRALAHEL